MSAPPLNRPGLSTPPTDSGTSSSTSSSGSLWKWAVGVVAAGLVGALVFMLLLVGSIAGGKGESTSGCGPALAAINDGVTGGGLPVAGKIRDQQIANAKAIDAAVRKLGLPGRATEIATIAAHGEATLINLNYGDDKQGVTNPDGSPTSSIGLFQQQKWWGTTAQRMNPEYATISFLTGIKHDRKGGLLSVPNWQTREITEVIHEVQGNSDASHYLRSYGPAREIMSAAGIDITRAGDSKAGALPTDTTGTNLTVAADNCGSNGGGGAAGTVNAGDAKDDYPWKGRTPGPGIYIADPLAFYYGECVSFVAWKLNQYLGGNEQAPYKFANNTGGVQKGSGVDWRGAWEKLGWKVSKTPVKDSVAWWGANGAPGIGPSGHVAYVQAVKGDSVLIGEYNNSGLAPPGHKYSQRTIKASEVNAFLYPPPKG